MQITAFPREITRQSHILMRKYPLPPLQHPSSLRPLLWSVLVQHSILSSTKYQRKKKSPRDYLQGDKSVWMVQSRWDRPNSMLWWVHSRFWCLHGGSKWVWPRRRWYSFGVTVTKTAEKLICNPSFLYWFEEWSRTELLLKERSIELPNTII